MAQEEVAARTTSSALETMATAAALSGGPAAYTTPPSTPTREKPSTPATVTPRHPVRWTRNEDQAIRHYVEKKQSDEPSAHLSEVVDWDVVSENVVGTGRSAAACRDRWEHVLSRGLHKGRFREDEDAKIKELAVDGVQSDWRDIAAKVGGRTPKQCRASLLFLSSFAPSSCPSRVFALVVSFVLLSRTEQAVVVVDYWPGERWQNSLDPSLSTADWTANEDALLQAAHDRWGNSWGQVIQALPGRSQNMAKNRWNSTARKARGDTFGAAATVDAKAAVAALRDKHPVVVAAMKDGGTPSPSAGLICGHHQHQRDEAGRFAPDGTFQRRSTGRSRRRQRHQDDDASAAASSTSSRSDEGTTRCLTALISAATSAFESLQDPAVGSVLRYRWTSEPIDLQNELVEVVARNEGRYTLRCLDVDHRRRRVPRDSDEKRLTFDVALPPSQYGTLWVDNNGDAALKQESTVVDRPPPLVPPPPTTTTTTTLGGAPPLPKEQRNHDDKDKDDDGKSLPLPRIQDDEEDSGGDIFSASENEHENENEDSKDQEETSARAITMSLRPKKKRRCPRHHADYEAP